jgi:SAM-dependent methyltransferase
MNGINEKRKKRQEAHWREANWVDNLEEHEDERFDIAVTMMKSGKILDVGSQTGKNALFLKNNGNEVIGVEIVEELVEATKQKGIECYQLDVETDDFPFNDKEFDTVWAGDILEHLLNPRKFLKEVNRVLKDEGVFVLTVPNIASLRNRLQLLIKGKLSPNMVTYTSKRGHMLDYDIHQLNAALSDADFKITKVITPPVTVRGIKVPFWRKHPEWGSPFIVQCKNMVE